ncbi:hypothetical protein AABC04_12745 [Lactiplantibacillus plantarum]|uniref:hypothetical protein n=1 Tax=Lactiplantibacillus plantarum TaxID=1590 RepID=UPI00311F0DEF
MKYSEAEKRIKALSSKYDVVYCMADGDFTINYKNMLVAWVRNNKRYLFYNNEIVFKKLPFSNKLYMILAELAITPLDERVEETKQYVKVFDNEFGYLNIDNSTGEMIVSGMYESYGYKTKFTDKEIEQLKQRDDIPLDWNKVNLKEAE